MRNSGAMSYVVSPDIAGSSSISRKNLEMIANDGAMMATSESMARN
jgi:hypothetical protein